jgi:hypothetical protein
MLEVVSDRPRQSPAPRRPQKRTEQSRRVKAVDSEVESLFGIKQIVEPRSNVVVVCNLIGARDCTTR